MNENEKKRKISTCVYVHSILHCWACMLISEGHFIEYDCWWEFVCELSKIIFFFVFTLPHLFESEMSDLLLGTLGHCPFHHYVYYWCDFTPCLIWVDHHFSSYIHFFAIILVISCDSAHSLHLPCSFLTLTYSRFDISLAPFLHILLSVWFASLSHYWYFIHIRHPQVHGSQAFLYMLHFIHEGMSFLSLGIWA